MVLLVALYGLLAALSLLYMYLKSGKRYWQNRGVLTRPAHFFLGHIKDVAKTVHISERQNEFYNEFKGKDTFCGIYLMDRPVAIVTDLELVRDIFVKDFSKFHDRGVYVNEKADPLTPHLFSLSGIKWNHMRNKLSPLFTSGRLKQMFSTIVDIADNMKFIVEKHISTDKMIDVKRLCIRYSTDAVLSTVFGLDTKTLENDDAEILEIPNLMYKSSVANNLKVFFMNSYRRIAHKLRMKIFSEVVAKYFLNIIRQTVEYRERDEVTKRKDFVDILIKSKNSDGVDAENFNGKFTYNELAATAFDFFFAGFETSSAAMSFCLLQLALNENIQSRLHDEIQIVFQKYDNRLTYEAVAELTYLEQCFNEAMRLFPPAHSLIRETTDDYKVPGTNHVLEKGIQVLIPAYSIHRDADIYPDPLKYDPDRFTPEQIKLRHPYAFLPFGEGPRMCIAMRYAMLQSKVGLATILSNFRVTVNPKTQLPVQLEIDNPDMGVQGGVWLDFEKI